MLDSHIGEFLACSLGQKPQVSQMVGAAPPWSTGSIEASPARRVIKSSNLGQALTQKRPRPERAVVRPGKDCGLPAPHAAGLAAEGQRAVQWWKALNWSHTLQLLKGADQGGQNDPDWPSRIWNGSCPGMALHSYLGDNSL